MLSALTAIVTGSLELAWVIVINGKALMGVVTVAK